MKVLIIDDEPLVRRSLQKVFEKQGHEVWVASDGIEGLDLWTDTRPQVVFLDVLMPGLSGPQLLTKLDPDLRSQTKVLLMSAYSGHQEAGLADRFIAKPFEDVFTLVKLAEELNKNG